MRGGANNFDLLRLSAALLVLFSHAFILAGRADEEPIAPLLRHVTDGGGLAVAAFFVLSGYLVAGSAARHGWRAYLRARALRIAPAYAVAVLVQTLLLGPLVSRLGVGAYLAEPATWGALGRALLFSPRAGLPWVFEGNPLPDVVNGSLWTLRIEVACYAAVLVWILLGRARVWVVLALVAGVVALGLTHAIGAGVRVVAILDCLLFFASGAALWCWRVTVRLWVVAALALGFALLAGTGAGWAAWHLLLPCAVLWLGMARPVLTTAIRGLGDVSYGTYLYAFPVEQVIVAAAPGISPWALAAAATGPALLLGFVSSRLIERPALRWKERFR